MAMIQLGGRGREERAGAGEPTTVNGLIQARIDGRISRRELTRRAAVLGIAAPVVGVMLHATSDHAFGAPSRGRALPTRLAQEAVPVSGPTAPEGTPAQGGTLVVGTASEPDTLQPYISQTVTAADFQTGIFDGLLGYDSTQTLQPALATEFAISDDGLVYTFTLREGVTFHNGDPFTGEDVVNAWKIIMDEEFGAFNTQGWDKVTDIAVDGATLTITTGEVYAPFMSYVPVTDLVPSSAIAKGIDSFKQEFGRAPIGTGPMRFVEWKAKEQIVVERFDSYWGNPPKLDRVVTRLVPDDNTQLVQLRTGEIQMVGSGGALSPTRVDEALEIENVVILEHPTQDWQHMDLKHVDFLRMTKVRQALDFATPTQDIIDKLLKGRAVRSIADQVPGSWAHNPNIEPRPYDLEQAKALLAEAGLTPGDDGVLEGKVPTTDPNVGDGEVKPFEIELWFVSGNSETERNCQVVAQSWNSIGIKTEVFNQDISTIWGPEGYQFTDAMTASMWTWTNGNDPSDEYYWASSQIPDRPDGSGGNLPAYFHEYNFQAEIDDLTARADATTVQEERKAIFDQIQEVLHREVPVIFMYWPNSYPAVAPNIGGFWPSAFTYLMWNVQDWYLME